MTLTQIFVTSGAVFGVCGVAEVALVRGHYLLNVT